MAGLRLQGRPRRDRRAGRRDPVVEGLVPQDLRGLPRRHRRGGGVYHTVLERALPASLPLLTSQAAAGLTSIAELADEFFWWPFPELGTTIEFNLTNPVTNQTFLSAGPETRYWMNKWMNDEVVQRHGEGGEVGGGLGLGQPPIEVGGLAGGLQGGAFVADLRQQDISTTLGESLPVRRFHPLKRWHQTE